MLRLLTGRAYLLEDALCGGVGRSMAETGLDQLVIVPKQLTLQTEQTLLARLKLSGSFRLQVLSPERLCGRIFAAAGYPEGERVDDRGRALLVREAAREAQDALTLYKNAYQRRGFAERAARQLELLRQGGVTPAALDECADREKGQLALKMKDLARLLSAYEERIAGRYQDGETEFLEAVRRARSAAFLREAEVWFYGFDITPPPLNALMAEVSAAAPRAAMLFPMEPDEDAPDAEVFEPLRRARRRLLAAARASGVETECVSLPDGETRRPEIMHLERQLFAQPAVPWPNAPRDVQLVCLRNPREEARFAAALVRRLCRKRGMRYNDIVLLCQDIEGYSLYLREAFEEADIPLFLSVSRPASRHALAEYLLSALRLLSRNFRAEDLLAHLNTGYTALTREEADRFSNYVVRWGVRGKAFLSPLRRGLPAEVEVMEPLRRQLVEPLERLQADLKEAGSLVEQLQAVFRFLEDTDAYAKSLRRQNELALAGRRQLANELSQVWNRMLGAMDQMAALLGEKKVALREMEQLLTEALDAAVMKPLPQAGDAVYAQGLDRMLDRPVRAALLLGLTDRPAAEDEGLLSDAQRREVAEATKAYLGPGADEKSCLRRFYLKTDVGMAREYLCASYPLSGADNSAQRPGAAVEQLQALFPALRQRGGMMGEDAIVRMLDCVPAGALKRLAGELARDGAGQRLAATLMQLGSPALESLRRAMDRRDAGVSMDPATAERLYGDIRLVSVTRLERFAECPFAYFAQYGLTPEKIDPYRLRPSDEGTFLHDAIRDFLEECGGEIREISEERADAAMDRTADRLLDAMSEGPLGDTAVSLAEKRRLKATARASAQALVRHMRGSAFSPSAIEVSFGPGDGMELRLPGEDCALDGRIDRIDSWDEGGYLRVIDYKRGGEKLNLWEVYWGYRLQLMVYLAVAQRQRSAGSAGAYYFTLDEGILSTQSTDEAAVRREREKKFRLSGVLPNDPEVLRAMSPDYPEVFAAQFGKNGLPYQSAAAATQEDFQRLTRRTLDMAREHLRGIRGGSCAASPVEREGRRPCAWCDWKSVCLFDPEIDARRVRRPAPMRADEVLLRLAREDGEEKET